MVMWVSIDGNQQSLKSEPLRNAGIEFEEMASLHALIAATVMSCLYNKSEI